MFFQTYPLTFRDIYGMGPGVMGLMYLPVGVGTLMGVFGSQLWDPTLRRAKRRGKEPNTQIDCYKLGEIY